jgi:DNA-binding transcriptional ArsR family regulator
MVIADAAVEVADDADAVARLFRAVSDPTRVRILQALMRDPCTTQDLLAVVGTSQPNVWKHLRCLMGCGLVTARSEGRQRVYSITTSSLLDLLASAETLLDAVGAAVNACPNVAEGQSGG